MAIFPDLMWRLEPGADLTDRTQAELDKAVALYTAFDLDTGVLDTARTLECARRLPGTTGKVGVLGFCLGGLMSFLACTRVGADMGRKVGQYVAQNFLKPMKLAAAR